MINRTPEGGRRWRRRRRRSETVVAGGGANTRDGWFFRNQGHDEGEERGEGVTAADDDDDDDDETLPIHASLWERGQELERRKEAGARSREEARRARASAGHVNGRSAELVRAMRVRSLVQTYRTLLASVEYARLPEGLDYDEVQPRRRTGTFSCQVLFFSIVQRRYRNLGLKHRAPHNGQFPTVFGDGWKSR